MKEQISLSIIEAASIVGIGRTSLYQAIASGQLPVKKFGRRTLVEYSALQKFISELPGQGKGGMAA